MVAMVSSATKRASIHGFDSTSARYVCWKCRRSLATQTATRPAAGLQQADVLRRRSRRSKVIRTYATNHHEDAKSPDTAPRSDVPFSSLGQFIGLQMIRNGEFRPGLNRKRIQDELREWQHDHNMRMDAERERKAKEAHEGMSPLTELILKAKSQRVGDREEDLVTDDADLDGNLFDPFEETQVSYKEKPMQPGDLVDFAGQCRLAVFVKRAHGHGSNQFSLLYGIDGMIYEVRSNQIHFRSAGFFSPAELEEMLPYFPISDVTQLSEAVSGWKVESVVPRGIGAPIIRKLSQFKKEADDIYRSNASRFDNSHRILAEKARRSVISLHDAACKLLKLPYTANLSPVQLWTVHRNLEVIDYGFERAPAYQASPKWIVMSQKHASTVESVEDWWHAYQTRKMNIAFVESHNQRQKDPSKSSGGEIEGFIKMAQKEAGKRRKVRHYDPKVGFLGPVKADVQPMSPAISKLDIFEPQSSPTITEHYNETHASIMRFLLLTSHNEVDAFSPSAAIAGMIVQETRLYADIDDSRQLVLLFLQEMGIVSPWEDHTAGLLRFLQPDNTSVMPDDEIMPRSENSGSECEDFVDSMEDIRKDWGDLDVYCIDSKGTVTIDDGISVERIEGDESQLWVHVHVANPTAFLHKDHPMMKRANTMGSTLYTPNAVFTMMDESFISNVVSLQGGRPCLTFSAKIDDKGDVLEQNITHGLIRNVSFVTPEVISEILGIENVGKSDGEPVVIQIGPKKTLDEKAPSRQLKSPSDFTQRQINDLKVWHQFMQSLFNKRAKKRDRRPEVKRRMRKCDVIIQDAPPVSPDCTRVRTINCDPTVSIQMYPGQRDNPMWLERVDVVAEAMTLAGTVAASWCIQREIPVPFFGQTTVKGMPSRRSYFQEILKPLLDQGQPVPRKLVYDLVSLDSPSLSTDHRPHNEIGVDALVKVTSPLRQWADTLAHFQIDSALRYEAGKKGSQAGKISRRRLQFSTRQMSDECRELEIKLRLAKLLMDWRKNIWIFRTIGRCIHFGEATLPERLTAYVNAIRLFANSEKVQYDIKIAELGVRCRVADWSGNISSEIQSGDLFEAEILGVNFADKLVEVRLGDLVRRLPENLEKEEIDKLSTPEDDV